MKKILGFLNKSFVRNVIVLASGTAGAQAIAMLLSPIITRLYGPEAFGMMGTFTSIVSIVTPVAALTYPIAIVLPKKDIEAKQLIRLSLYITFFLSFLSFVIIVILKNRIVEVFNLTDVTNYLYLIPLVVIFAGLMQVSEQWLIRTKQFVINARVTLLQSIIINGSKVGVGLYYPYAIVLIILTVFANGLRAGMMILFINKSKRNQEKKIELEKNKNLKELAKKYYDFPFYRAPEVFLFSISTSLPILMLAAFFGPASAGFYSIGRTVLRVPSQLIGESVGNVFYPRIAEAYNKNENILKLIMKATLSLGVVGIIPYGLIILLGPMLFGLVFGNEWVVAGEYARWIALGSFFGFMNRPSVRALPVLSAQKFHLIYTIITLLIRLGALVIGAYVFSSDSIAVTLFGISDAILNIGLILITMKISQQKMQSL